MSHHASGGGLPAFLHGYFWEYPAGRVRPDADGEIVMLRLMESGDQDAIRWLRAEYGDPSLAEFMTRRRARGLSEKRIRYWALLLRLPRQAVDAWLAALRTNPWYLRVRR
jgi:hypothetical protein